MERLTGAESTMVERDAVPNPWHVTDVTVLAGNDLTVGEVAARVAERIAYVPRFRQRVDQSPLGDQWVDDADFDVRRHVRALALPPRTTIPQLQASVANMLHEPLPRRGPRWEIAVVGSISRGRSALVTRVHPAWVDGVDNVHLLQELFDDTPIADPPVAAAWEPAAPSAEAGQVVGAARDPLATLGGLGRTLTRLARTGLEQAGAIENTRLTRHVVGAGASLDSLRKVAHGFGVGIHDVIISMVAGGLYRIGERRDSIALVPQAVESEAATALGFGVRPDTLALPVRVPDPVARLGQVASMNQVRWDAGGLVPAPRIVELPGFVPPTLEVLGVRETVSGRPHEVAIVDVPGPRLPRYLGTRPVEASYPVLSLVPPQRLTVGVTSYAGRVLFGITSVDPVTELGETMTDELQDLLREVERR